MMPLQRRKSPPSSRSTADTSPMHPALLPRNASTAYGDMPSLSATFWANSVTGSASSSLLLPAAPAVIAVFIAESGVAEESESTESVRGRMNDDICDVKEKNTNTLPASAGFIQLQPRPPNVHLTTVMANADAISGI